MSNRNEKPNKPPRYIVVKCDDGDTVTRSGKICPRSVEHVGPIVIEGRIDCGVAGHPDQVYSILNTMFQHIGDVSRFVCAQGD